MFSEVDLVVKGHFGHITGYSTIANEVALGLHLAGFRLAIMAGNPEYEVTKSLFPPNVLPFFIDWSQTDAWNQLKGKWNIVMSTPVSSAIFGLDEKSILLTMWETDLLKPEEVEQINKSALILVPNHWNKESFMKCGVTTPIKVISLGYDQSIFYPNYNFPEICTFGAAASLGGGGIRKNPLLLISAFQKAFPSQSDVRLKIKLSPVCQMENIDDPRIEIKKHFLSARDLAKWYCSLTAFVNTSSGEGFGLHLLEAMACGRTVISTKFAGPAEYFDNSVGYELDYTLAAVENGGDIYIGNWSQIKEESLVKRLQEVYHNQAKARKLGYLSGIRAKQFTWKTAGRKILNSLPISINNSCV